MAVVFELVVNFGTNVSAADSCVEFRVVAGWVRYGGIKPEGLRAADLTDAEVGLIGEQLYQLLRRFDGYQVAMVGWDPEEAVALDELAQRIGETGLSRLDGIVMADRLVEAWGLARELAPFEPGYRWRPYAGSPNPRRAGSLA